MRATPWLGAATIALLAPTAHAQMGINPFRTVPSIRLTATDMDQLLASTAKLNTTTPATIGATTTWSDPKTKSAGTNTLLKTTQAHNTTCHEIQHQITIAGHTPPQTYNFTWCRTKDGTWKAAH